MEVFTNRVEISFYPIFRLKISRIDYNIIISYINASHLPQF